MEAIKLLRGAVVGGAGRPAGTVLKIPADIGAPDAALFCRRGLAEESVPPVKRKPRKEKTNESDSVDTQD